MKKPLSLWHQLLVLSLLFAFPAMAMPPVGGGGHSTPSVDLLKELQSVKNLVVTLEYPRDATWLIGIDLPANAQGNNVSIRVPVTEEKSASFPLAVVDEAPLTIGGFRKKLLPAETTDGQVTSVSGEDPAKLLERMIDSLLFEREAREMGLDKLPEVQEQMQLFRRDTLRLHLMEKITSMAKEDEKKVTEIYRMLIGETKLKAVLFDKKSDAQAFVAKLKGRSNQFDKLAAELVAGKKAVLKGGVSGEYMPHREMPLETVKVIVAQKPETVSPVILASDKYGVFYVYDTRYPDDPQAKVDARERARNAARKTALVSFAKSLRSKYVTLDKKLFDSLDFNNKLEELLSDQRTVVRIKGSDPVTVADVAKAIKYRYFHGVKRAAEGGKIDDEKKDILDGIIDKRVFYVEALSQKLDTTDKFTKALSDHESSMLFGAFLKKAVVPGMTLSMNDLREYYQAHTADYSISEMLTLRSISFADLSAAQAALEKIRQGTDFQWLLVNASDQYPLDSPNRIEFVGNTLSLGNASAELREALTGANAGDARLYSDGKGQHVVILIEESYPARVQSFEQVQSEILKTVYQQKLQEEVKEWALKLRGLYPVNNFVKEFNQTKL